MCWNYKLIRGARGNYKIWMFWNFKLIIGGTTRFVCVGTTSFIRGGTARFECVG
jgi:hypothetical protein